jgi:hypothetical protein
MKVCKRGHEHNHARCLVHAFGAGHPWRLRGCVCLLCAAIAAELVQPCPDSRLVLRSAFSESPFVVQHDDAERSWLTTSPAPPETMISAGRPGGWDYSSGGHEGFIVVDNKSGAVVYRTGTRASSS